MASFPGIPATFLRREFSLGKHYPRLVRWMNHCAHTFLICHRYTSSDSESKWWFRFESVDYTLNIRDTRETFNSSGCFSFCHFTNPSYLHEDKRREAILQALFISRLTNGNCNNISPTDKTRLSARTIEKLRAHEDNASVSRGRERVLWLGTFPGILSACCFRNVSYKVTIPPVYLVR